MRYLGGKSRHAKAIAAVINPVRGARTLWDPFCGGLASAAAFGGRLVCSDVRPGLIALYREVQRDPHFLDEFERPGLLTRGLFVAAKAADRSCPVATLIRFGGAFGGDPAGGYSPRYPKAGKPGEYREWLGEAARSLRRQMRTLGAAHFRCLDFLACAPLRDDGHAVLYLDPPYPGTTGYGMAFDHDAFLARARAWAAVTDVWVSGYAWPTDAGALVWEAPAGGKRGLPTSGRERLWKVRA
jgi:site-specific DNA-adenine methylase